MTNVDRPFQSSRRRFLKQSFAFSAAAMLPSALTGCGSGYHLVTDPTISSAPSHLLMVGDWGASGDYSAQTSVAQGMQTFAQRYSLNIQALLMLGDNFYGSMPHGSTDSRWNSQFEQMYPSSAFDCTAYAIPGNHDYELRPGRKYDYELAYAATGKSRFTMPSQYYSFVFPKDNPVITFLAVDTNMPFSNGQTQIGTFVCMTEAQRVAQLAWLEQQLALPRTTPFLGVIGHHPVYSNGQHGDNAILIQDFDPLFRKYGVDIYIAGHDHDLQHLEFSGHPTTFFMSGGGGAPLYDLVIDESVRGPYAQRVFGFSHLRVTATEMHLRHLNSSGSLLHSFTKTVDGTVTILK